MERSTGPACQGPFVPARCGLSELDGLAALPGLQEIYLAFNNISQLSPLTTLEELQVPI